MRTLIDWLIGWPERIARYFGWFAPLIARITAGYVFTLTGWAKLHHLPQVTENFANWGIPNASILAPFVSGLELFGGLFLMAGLLTRISAGALGVVMIVAIKSAQWADVESLDTLLGLDETLYLAIFLWLAIAGPGALSLDYIIQRSVGGRARAAR